MDRERQCTVLVVGAGIAGLSAAKELSKHFHDVLVVEATDRTGGRVKQATGVLPHPVELGPQFIHGGKSSFIEVIKQAGCNWTEYEWPDRWYFTKGKRMLQSSDIDNDADISAVNDMFGGLGESDYPARDLSAEAWMRQKGANANMMEIAEACYANDFGCSLSQMGLRETVLEKLRWQSVPLKILQRGDISFSPVLPTWKQEAIGRLQMSTAIKVTIVLDERIWPDDFFDVVCPGGFISEFWVVDKALRKSSAQSKQFGIFGFAAGLKAEAMSSMGEAAIISNTLAQLDEIFGHMSTSRYPATKAFVKAHIADWSKEKYIGGAYSYPTLGAEIGDRDALAAPVGNKIFFAGEACHPGVNPCLQAAHETGLIAAQQIRNYALRSSKL